jgi:aromatic ring-opening dioxygenase catalytic subunit (LigB family)
MYPEADIPCVQLSLIDHLDAQTHIDMGKALNVLLKENILIVGSGFTFHNMKEFRGNKGRDVKNEAFEAWLIDTGTNQSTTVEQK